MNSTDENRFSKQRSGSSQGEHHPQNSWGGGGYPKQKNSRRDDVKLEIYRVK